MIEGIFIERAFINPEQAEEFMDWVDRQPWDASLRRRVQHYGYRYDYKARRANPDDRLGPLPRQLQELASRVRDYGFDTEPDQVIVNEYLPGQGISSHTDCLPCFGPVIASVSLGSGAEMKFTKAAKQASIYLHPRSLLVMSDGARTAWKHEIPARKSDMIDGVRTMRGRRVSLTFRTVSFHSASS